MPGSIFDSVVAVSDENHLYWRYSEPPSISTTTFAGFFIGQLPDNIISSTILETDAAIGVTYLAVFSTGTVYLQPASGDFTPAFETTLRVGLQFNNVIYDFQVANDTDSPYQWSGGADAIALYNELRANPTLTLTGVLYDTESGSPINPNTLELADAIEFQGQAISLGLALSQAILSPQSFPSVDFQGQSLSLGLALSQATLSPFDAYAEFRGQLLSLGLSLSRATLSPLDATQVDFQGQPISFGLSLSQATLAVHRLINILGRASPIRNSDGVLVRPEAIFAPIPALKLTGAFPVFCPSKRVLLGSKVYPFAGLDYIGNSELVSASWRQKLNNSSFSVAQNVPLGNFTDILAAIRFTPQTLDEYGTYLYEISLINESNGTATININILCNVIAGTDKSVQRNITFKPFADFMIAKNSQAIKNIEYEISGDTTLSRRSVGRSTIFLGQHEAIHNAGYVYDGKRDFNRVDINLGSDILYNVNDMCSGIIMSIGNDGNALIPDMLSGGTLNEFNPGDYYQVQDGDDVDKRARKLELSIDELSTSLIQLFATDQQDGVSVGNVLVRCD